MKISNIFKLGANQFELDFVDIDPECDMPLFIDPFFLSTRSDRWSIDASRILKSFFQHFVDLYKAGQIKGARGLLDYLHEPNELCLGLSSENPQGLAIGTIDGEKLFKSIIKSKAIHSGIVEDIQDFRLFIDGIDRDKISDMSANILKMKLIEYTQAQCELWQIPLQKNVSSGFYWNKDLRKWETAYTQMLVINDKPIILTPKHAVSYCKQYTPKKYYSKFVLEFLQHDHLQRGTNLVQERKSGALYVTKKSLTESEAPFSKEFLADFTQRHPQVFEDFKNWVSTSSRAISNSEIDDSIESIQVAEYLKKKLLSIAPGNLEASIYHRAAVGILEFLFYPHLTCPIIEEEIHQGRKRIDVVFDNASTEGFFHRLDTIHRTPCPYIIVECKNYNKEMKNPELDQLSGRFSPRRGQFGLLLCRSADNIELLLQRCSDTFNDDRGTIIPLTDEDLVIMLDAVIKNDNTVAESLLNQRLRKVKL